MGLGEVERFIPGEQAVGERRGCQSSRDPTRRHGLSGGLDTGPAAHLPCTPTLDAVLLRSQQAPHPQCWGGGGSVSVLLTPPSL